MGRVALGLSDSLPNTAPEVTTRELVVTSSLSKSKTARKPAVVGSVSKQ